MKVLSSGEIIIEVFNGQTENGLSKVCGTLDHRVVMLENENFSINEISKHCDINS